MHVLTAHTTATSTPLGRVTVREGDRLEAGQVVATLGTAALAVSAVGVAASAVAVADRRLDQARRPWREGTVLAARATVAARAAELDLAGRQRRRTEELLRRAVRSGSEMEQRVSEETRARALLAEAQAQLAALTGVAEIDVRVAEAERDQARARLAQAEAELELTCVRAPAAGQVLRLRARAGDLGVAQPILEMADLTRLKVMAEVDERHAPRLGPGLRAGIGLPGGPVLTEGTIRRIGASVRVAERTQPDTVTASGGRMVEVEIEPDRAASLPLIVGLELLVRIERP